MKIETTTSAPKVGSSAVVRLPSDVARCDGVGFDEDGRWDWREGCETCLRRTASRGDMLRTSFINPPAIIAFECEFFIEPNAITQIRRAENFENTTDGIPAVV